MATQRKTPKPGSEREAGEQPAAPKCEHPEAEDHFTRGVLTRGEAAAPDEQGNLPPGVTHELVHERSDESPEIHRRRFSAY